MRKNLDEIVESCRNSNGEGLTHKDLIDAVVALDHIMLYEYRVLLRLVRAERTNEEKQHTASTEWQWRKIHDRRERAYSLPPGDYRRKEQDDAK